MLALLGAAVVAGFILAATLAALAVHDLLGDG